MLTVNMAHAPLVHVHRGLSVILETASRCESSILCVVTVTVFSQVGRPGCQVAEGTGGLCGDRGLYKPGECVQGVVLAYRK